MTALDALATWPVRLAGAAVVTSDVVVERAGAVDERLSWASVTKVATALAVLVGVEEGTVDLDGSAGPAGSTIRHLLAHTSGLPLDAGEPAASPATRRIYSNAGFELLGLHLAERAGTTFGEYLTEAVLEPLGLDATRLVGSPASGMVGTVSDLAALGRELLAPTLIDPSTLALARAVAYPGLAGVLPGYGRQEPNDWGLGLELRADKSPHWTGRRNSPATFGHFGRAGGFLWVDPVAGLACACLTDRPFGPWAIDAWPSLSDAVLATHAC